jgi:hypothetical protein
VKYYQGKSDKTGGFNVCLYLAEVVHTTNNFSKNEILGWEGVGNRQLLCFFKA